jgi:pyoverdine/dityrosine biosynthesis protein Dit1
MRMYNIKEIHYRDIYGRLIWKDEIVFSSLWGIGNEIIYDYQRYIVRRVAVADTVQHVNIELDRSYATQAAQRGEG